MMTKTDRAELEKKGLIILRAKFNGKTKWEVFQYSSNGGWVKYKGDYDYFSSKEQCDVFINVLVLKNENIVKDE
jgi:hypothetical protein